MLEAEAIMHEQINRDEKCSEIAGEIMAMRAAMSILVQDRSQLGDREPILVNCFSSPVALRQRHVQFPALGRRSVSSYRVREGHACTEVLSRRPPC